MKNFLVLYNLSIDSKVFIGADVTVPMIYEFIVNAQKSEKGKYLSQFRCTLRGNPIHLDVNPTLCTPKKIAAFTNAGYLVKTVHLTEDGQEYDL